MASLSMNQVVLAGNLTRDPEVKFLASGTACADLRVAVNESYRNKQGEKKQETVFVTVTVWGNQAEACGKYLTKGRGVLIEGKLKYDTWEKDGKTNSRLTVTARRVQFGDGGGGRGDGGGTDGSGAAAVPASPAAEAATVPAVDPAAAGDDENLPF